MAKYNVAAMHADAQKAGIIWWNRAIQIFGRKIGEIPDIRMNTRLTATAGRAFSEADPQYIDLSCYLMERNPDAFIDEIIPHELAHILVRRIHKKCDGHGPLWKAIALKLYGRNDRTHALLTKGLAAKGYTKIERGPDGKAIFYKGNITEAEG